MTLDNARISGGSAPGVRIGKGAGSVTVANSRIGKSSLSSPAPDAVGILIEADVTDVLLSNNHLNENPAGSVRVDAPASGDRPASGLKVVANTIRDDGAAAVRVASAIGVHIADNTISVVPGWPESPGIVFEAVEHATVRRNHLSNFAVGVQIGRAGTTGNQAQGARDVTIDHNLLENIVPSGIAVDLEAGDRVRVVNNVFDGYGRGILVPGKPPLTKGVIVANNLFLGIASTAFVLADPGVVVLFDYNIFSPRGDSLDVEVGETARSPASSRGGTMPNTRLTPGVKVLDRDLARIAGTQTVDHGKTVQGVEFKGQAPDLGVAER